MAMVVPTAVIIVPKLQIRPRMMMTEIWSEIRAIFATDSMTALILTWMGFPMVAITATADCGFDLVRESNQSQEANKDRRRENGGDFRFARGFFRAGRRALAENRPPLVNQIRC